MLFIHLTLKMSRIGRRSSSIVWDAWYWRNVHIGWYKWTTLYSSCLWIRLSCTSPSTLVELRLSIRRPIWCKAVITCWSIMIWITESKASILWKSWLSIRSFHTSSSTKVSFLKHIFAWRIQGPIIPFTFSASFSRYFYKTFV